LRIKSLIISENKLIHLPGFNDVLVLVKNLMIKLFHKIMNGCRVRANIAQLSKFFEILKPDQMIFMNLAKKKAEQQMVIPLFKIIKI